MKDFLSKCDQIRSWVSSFSPVPDSFPEQVQLDAYESEINSLPAYI